MFLLHESLLSLISYFCQLQDHIFRSFTKPFKLPDDQLMH